MIKSINVTKPAMITIKQGRRTAFGMTFLSSDITAFEHTSTNVVARPIPMPFSASTVTASVGHIPSSVTSTGFSFIMPFVNS